MVRMRLRWLGFAVAMGAWGLALASAPTAAQPIDLSARVQMAYNYCTLSYTAALWSEAEWATEIRRLADAGFTHVLVNPGMEAVWFDFLTKHLGTVEGFSNYPPEAARAHIPHPAWRAWWLMGNLEGEGGLLRTDGLALTVNEIERQRRIGRVIVEACRAHGMVPVLNAFMGLLPTDFDQRFPEHLYLAQNGWQGYQRPDQLLPTDGAFPALAKAYHAALFEAYGLAQGQPVAFSGDLFHEGGAKPAEDAVATQCAMAVQAAMQQARPGAVWFVQHWNENPTVALMAGCDPNFTIIQKLDKDMRIGISPSPGNHYKGKGGELLPWIWTEVTNFGDRPNLYGSTARMAETKAYLASEDARQTKCLGWGMLDEGISYQKPYYATMLATLGVYADPARLPAALKIPTMAAKAWGYLQESVYLPTAYQEGCSEGIHCALPQFGLAYGHTSQWAYGGAYYDKRLVRAAAVALLEDLQANPALAADRVWVDFFVDVFCQVAVDAFWAVPEYRTPEFFPLLDELLLRSTTLHLDHYWHQAEALSRPVLEDGTLGEPNAADTLHHYRNYLCLLTIWKQGDVQNLSGLHDYSCRNLGGMMDAYYGRRWDDYWAGKDADAIRAVDAEWWKQATRPPQPIVPTAKDLERLAEAVLRYDIAAYDSVDATGAAPVDAYDFATVEAPNSGYSGRRWVADVAFTACPNGMVTGSCWSQVGMPTFGKNGGTVRFSATLGTIPQGVILSFNRKMDILQAQWLIKRGDQPGQAVVSGLFASGDVVLDLGGDDVLHRWTICRIPADSGDEVAVWVNERLMVRAPAVDGLPFFTGFQVNGQWGGGVGANAIFDDLRFYNRPLAR